MKVCIETFTLGRLLHSSHYIFRLKLVLQGINQTYQKLVLKALDVIGRPQLYLEMLAQIRDNFAVGNSGMAFGQTTYFIDDGVTAIGLQLRCDGPPSGTQITTFSCFFVRRVSKKLLCIPLLSIRLIMSHDTRKPLQILVTG